MVHINFDDSQIRFLIRADYLGIVEGSRRIVHERHANAVRLLDDVTVGDDVALGIHDHA